MDPTLREHYQWLQTIVYALQLPEWTLEKEINRDIAFTYVANFAPNLGVTLHPNDPDFLPTVALKLSQILTIEEKVASIPENLEELVRTYEEHLEESRKKTLKITFPTLDEQIEKLYREYQQKIKKELSESEKELATNPILCEELSHQFAIKLINSLPQTARREGPGSLSKQEYEFVFTQLSPLTIKEFEKAGVEKPKILTDYNLVRKFLEDTSKEAKELSFTPHTIVSIVKLQSLEKKRILTTEIAKEAPIPQISDLPYLQWQASGVRVPLYRRPVALAKKAIAAPIVKPIQWFTHFAPEKVRKENLSLIYTARGYTPIAVDQTLRYLYQQEPESPEIPFWQSLKAIFKTEKPPFLTLFEHYYEWDRLGKAGTKIEVLVPSRLIRTVTFGRFDNFPSLSLAFWKFFKKTRIGGFLSRGAGKILVGLGKLTSALSGIGTALLAWDTFKKAMKAAGAYLLGLLMIAAHYGAAAVTGSLLGALGGGIAGGVIGYKIGGLIGAAIGGPVGIIIGGTIGFVVGIFAQFIWDKITAAVSGISLPQIGTTGLTEASAATVSTAKWFVPAAVGTATVGGLIVSQIVSSAFVIPSEEVRITSPYIEVTKTVEFSGNLGDPIRYSIRVKAVDKDLTNVKIVDQPTATCRGTLPSLSEHSWNGTISIPTGGVWEQSYTVATNDQFNDCLISNTVRVTALVEGKTEESFSVGYVSIGNPPEVIPWGLPIHDNPDRGTGYTFGQITEEGIRHQGIDVHGPEGATVYSTFNGESKVTNLGYSAKGGYYIILSAGKYQIYMGHLAQRPNLRINDPVGAQAPVGKQGDSGHSFGEHVHYQIWENGVIVDPRLFGIPSPPW